MASIVPGLSNMVSNETATRAGAVLTRVMEATKPSASNNGVGYVVTGVVIAFALLLRRLSSIPLDSREPPLARMSVPYYGFLLGLYRKRMDYFDMIKPSKQEIVTVQILNDKAYVTWSPSIIQTCMRHKNMSIADMGIGFANHVFGMPRPEEDPNNQTAGTDEPVALAHGNPLDPFLNGKPLFAMNVVALTTVADAMNAIPANAPLEIPNLYRWLRNHITLATTNGLFGGRNPFRRDLSLVDNLFLFESERPPIVLGRTILKLLPGGGKLGSLKAFEARETIYRQMIAYFAEDDDLNDDVSALVKSTGQYYRSHGLNSEQMARNSLPLIWVSTVNTIPTMYWFFTNVLLRPQLIERVRREFEADTSETPVLKVTRDASGKSTGAVIDISQIEAKCPLLVSCYRETIRLANQLFGLRMVDKDVTITDPNGAQYLLKAGHYVIWSGKSMHRQTPLWDNANEFDPDRFTPEREAEKEARKRKQAYVPFGGGKHLCPGRHFAFAENLGFLAAMVLGFELDGLKQENVRMGRGKVTDAITQPTPEGEGGRVRISRRPGWENVEWSYKC